MSYGYIHGDFTVAVVVVVEAVVLGRVVVWDVSCFPVVVVAVVSEAGLLLGVVDPEGPPVAYDVGGTMIVGS